jgi:hypothetical protein
VQPGRCRSPERSHRCRRRSLGVASCVLHDAIPAWRARRLRTYVVEFSGDRERRSAGTDRARTQAQRVRFGDAVFAARAASSSRRSEHRRPTRDLVRWSLWVPIIRFGTVSRLRVCGGVWRARVCGSRPVIAARARSRRLGTRVSKEPARSGLRRGLVLVDQPAEQVTAAQAIEVDHVAE